MPDLGADAVQIVRLRRSPPAKLACDPADLCAAPHAEGLGQPESILRARSGCQGAGESRPKWRGRTCLAPQEDWLRIVDGTKRSELYQMHQLLC